MCIQFSAPARLALSSFVTLKRPNIAAHHTKIEIKSAYAWIDGRGGRRKARSNRHFTLCNISQPRKKGSQEYKRRKIF